MSRSSHALVVSSDAVLVSQVRSAVEARGLRVTRVSRADEVLDLLKKDPAALVVAELDLTGLDGVALCGALKALDQPPRVVLVCESAGLPPSGASMADAALPRPLDGARTTDLIHALLDDGPARAATSVVDPAGSIFGLGGAAAADRSASGLSASIPSLDTSSIDILPGVDCEQEPDATGELPELAIESFDEGHPVSIPVDPSATAHFRPVAVEPIGEAPPSPPSGGAEAASVDASVEEAIARAVGPGGALASSLEKTVAEAVASALKQVLPAVAAEAARLVREDEEG